VTLSTAGSFEHVPPGLDAAAYRIVQEALTNVLKHARHAQAHVEVTSDGDTLRVSVVDRGDAAQPVSTSPGLGRGLYGIRERAALYGGHADIGPDAEGGFHVVVNFPVGGAT
jgi:signal transduction histidine kinase